MSSEVTERRPLAPAPWPVLAGVVAYVTLGSVAIVSATDNDWLALFGFVVIMATSAIALNKAGIERAAREPHPMYGVQKLPTDNLTRYIRAFMITGTLLVLIVVVLATAKPGETGSPLPHFLAFSYLFLVMPQFTARLAVKRADASGKAQPK